MKKTMLEAEHFYHEMLSKVDTFLSRSVNMDHPVCQGVLNEVLAPYEIGCVIHALPSCEFVAGHVYGLLKHYAELGEYRGEVFTKENLLANPNRRLMQY